MVARVLNELISERSLSCMKLQTSGGPRSVMGHEHAERVGFSLFGSSCIQPVRFCE